MKCFVVCGYTEAINIIRNNFNIDYNVIIHILHNDIYNPSICLIKRKSTGDDCLKELTILANKFPSIQRTTEEHDKFESEYRMLSDSEKYSYKDIIYQSLLTITGQDSILIGYYRN